jgi:antitoxin CptB
MLELDVLLGNFLEEAYFSLDEKDKEIFIRLLDFSDPDLFIYLTGEKTPAHPDIKYMIERIRKHAETRHSS